MINLLCTCICIKSHVFFLQWHFSLSNVMIWTSQKSSLKEQFTVRRGLPQPCVRTSMSCWPTESGYLPGVCVWLMHCNAVRSGVACSKQINYLCTYMRWVFFNWGEGGCSRKKLSLFCFIRKKVCFKNLKFQFSSLSLI